MYTLLRTVFGPPPEPKPLWGKGLEFFPALRVVCVELALVEHNLLDLDQGHHVLESEPRFFGGFAAIENDNVSVLIPDTDFLVVLHVPIILSLGELVNIKADIFSPVFI